MVYVLFLIHLGSGQVWLVSCSPQPHAAWMVQQGWNFSMLVENWKLPCRFMVHDRNLRPLRQVSVRDREAPCNFRQMVAICRSPRVNEATIRPLEAPTCQESGAANPQSHPPSKFVKRTCKGADLMVVRRHMNVL
jgi:hypothetical protein